MNNEDDSFDEIEELPLIPFLLLWINGWTIANIFIFRLSLVSNQNNFFIFILFLFLGIMLIILLKIT